MTLTGIALAGGQSRRFGRPKAIEPVDGVPMVLRVLQALRAAGCDPLYVVGGDPGLLTRELLGPVGAELIADLAPGEGPLGGVLTALTAASGDVVVAACDLPWIDPDTIRAVAFAPEAVDIDAVIAQVSGRHVALARWNQRSRDRIAEAFAAGERSWRAVLDGLSTVAIAVDARIVRDVDTPADLSIEP